MDRARASRRLDRDRAAAVADTVQKACRIPCSLCGEDGAVLHGPDPDLAPWQCGQCQAWCRGMGKEPACDKIHWYGALQAERFGGRYIYFCPCGLTWFASPILCGGRLAGALVGGPVLIMDEDDFFAHGLFQRESMDEAVAAAVRQTLDRVPEMPPGRVSALSEMLLYAALPLSDDSDRLLRTGSDQEQQGEISDYIAQLKKRPAGVAVGYPVDKERELTAAIAQGDQATAGRLLNEILGHLMLVGGDSFTTLRTRVTELLVVLSRAAIDGGADPEQIFGLNYYYLKELDNQPNFESLCRYLTDILRRFTSLVFEVSDIKHRDIIFKATAYIKEHYRERITLEGTAEYVGYSASYFSRVFKADTGSSFNNYLNEYRIEKAKPLLLSEGATVLSVSLEVGFDDPSYFSKVFKRVTGMSPGRFRETGGRAALKGKSVG